MQVLASWTNDEVPLTFIACKAFAYHSAELLEEGAAQYKELLEKAGADVQTDTAIVHIGAHIKTFCDPILEATAFLEEAAAATSFFAGPFREHILMHLGALYAFNFNFAAALDVYDRLWGQHAVEIDRSTSFFQWNAILLLWYIELATVEANNDPVAVATMTAALDGRWASLAGVVDAAEDQQHLVHGYLSLLVAFTLRRGGLSESAEGKIEAARVHVARLESNRGSICDLRMDGDAEIGEKPVAEREQLVHWKSLTLPLLEACVAFAGMLHTRAARMTQGGDAATDEALAVEAFSAAAALEASSKDALTAKLGGSDEQRLVFRLSFHAASILAQSNKMAEVHDQTLISWRQVRKSELLESHSRGRPHWPLELAWAHAGSSEPAGIGGA